MQTETAKSSDLYSLSIRQGFAHYFNQVINSHLYIIIGQVLVVFGQVVD